MKKILNYIRNFITNFYNKSENEKAISILIPYLITAFLIVPIGEVPKILLYILEFNLKIITPILIPILFVLPIMFKTKKGFLIYGIFIALIPNLIILYLYIDNAIYTKDFLKVYFIVLPILIGIFIAVNIVSTIRISKK